MSEETPTLDDQTDDETRTNMTNDATDLHRFQMRRTWESR